MYDPPARLMWRPVVRVSAVVFLACLLWPVGTATAAEPAKAPLEMVKEAEPPAPAAAHEQKGPLEVVPNAPQKQVATEPEKFRRPEPPSVFYAVFGPSGTTTLVDAGDEERKAYAGLLAVKIDGYGFKDEKTLAMRQVVDLALGGGSGGFEGWVAYHLGFGVLTGRPIGMVARLGVDTHVWGNQRVLSSGVTFPQLNLGVQWLTLDSVMELAGLVGISTIGRYNPEDSQRKLGGELEWGGHAAVHISGIHVDAAFRQIGTGVSEPHSPVSAVDGSVCVTPTVLGLCATLRYLRGTVHAPDGAVVDSDALYMGVMVGGAYDSEG